MGSKFTMKRIQPRNAMRCDYIESEKLLYFFIQRLFCGKNPSFFFFFGKFQFTSILNGIVEEILFENDEDGWLRCECIAKALIAAMLSQISSKNQKANEHIKAMNLHNQTQNTFKAVDQRARAGVPS